LLSSGADVPLSVALQAALETLPQNEQALVWSFDDAGDLELVADTTMDKAHIKAIFVLGVDGDCLLAAKQFSLRSLR
jgi:hypothetical protein